MRAVTPLLSSLQALPPSKYPSLLQQSLETDIFPEVISILHEDYVRYVGAVYLPSLYIILLRCNVVLVLLLYIAVVNCVLSNWGGWQRWSGSLWLWCFCLGRRKRVSWTWPYRAMPWQTKVQIARKCHEVCILPHLLSFLALVFILLVVIFLRSVDCSSLIPRLSPHPHILNLEMRLYKLREPLSFPKFLLVFLQVYVSYLKIYKVWFLTTLTI